ncbi:MAG: TonB-dependent receptor domain-containing protein [bacterium]
MDLRRAFLTASRANLLLSLASTCIQIFLAHTLFGQATSSVSGTVVDSRTGAPLTGANVVVKGTRLGAAARQDGSFLIARIPPGNYTLTASFIGYHTEKTEIEIKLTGAISGKIVDDKTGRPLAGIRVSIKGTSRIVKTGRDGSYLFADLSPGEYILQVMKEGYRPLESSVSVKANEVDFALREDILRGEEIVVTGIASTTSKAVAEVAVSRIPASGYTSQSNYRTTSQLIRGKLAGVQVKRASGNVGAGFRFTMRSGGGLNGDEQPVIYVDGVRVDNAEVLGFEVGGQGISLLADLNPEEIESIEVLKGPAGAVSYGTDGANGVVLITTKRGHYRAGNAGGVFFNYKLTAGWNKQSFDYSRKDYLSARDANDIFRTGTIVQNSLSASGGSNFIRYFAALDSRVEEGILEPNRLDRKNVRANFDVVPNDKLTLSLSSSYTFSTVERPSNDNNLFGYLINTTINPTSYLFVGGGRSAIENIEDENESNRFVASVRAEYQPIPIFSARMSLGIDDHDLRQDQNYPVNETYQQERFDSGLRNHFTRQGRLVTYSFDSRLDLHPLSDLHLSLVGGVQLFDRKVNTFSTQRYDFLTQLVTTIKAGTQQATIDETTLHERQAGLFGEANLAFSDRYYLSLKLRRDYASRIGRKASSIFYPGASFAVRLDKFRHVPAFFGLFKLRAAYGETGILPNSLDGINLHFRPESGAYGAGGVPGTGGNDKIKPERVKEIEIGFDAEFLNHFAVEFTYYKQKAKDSIFEFINSPSTGLPPTPVNIGEITGSGIETLLHASVVHRRDFDLSLTLINNWQENEVVDLGAAQPVFDSFALNVIQEGLPKHEFYTEPFLGALFNDDGTYFGPDFGEAPVALGNPVPPYTGSLALNLRLFKNLSLYALADWATGHKIWNGSKSLTYLAGNNPKYNLLATQLGLAGTFEADGVALDVEPVEDVIPFTPGTPEYIAAAEEFARMDPLLDANFIEQGDFVKLREVSLRYSFKGLLSKALRGRQLVQDIAITLSAHNLLTVTRYSGPEVEVNWSGARDLERGQDYFTLQNPRTYAMTLSVSF